MKNFTVKNGNKINPKLLKEHVGDIRYNLQKTSNILNESQINEKIEYILSSPSLRSKYFSEYRTQMLLEGKPVTQEGFMDALKNPRAAYQGFKQHRQLSKAEQQIKNVALKVVGNAENQYEQFQKKVKELEARGLKFPKLAPEAEKARKLIDGIKGKINQVFPGTQFGRTAAQADTDTASELTAGLEEGFMDSLRAGGDAAALGGLKKILSNITQSILTNYRSIKPQIEKIQALRKDPEIARGEPPDDGAAAELTAAQPAAAQPAAAQPAAAQPPPVPPEDTAQDDVKNAEDAGAVVVPQQPSRDPDTDGSNPTVTSVARPPATGAALSTGFPSEPVSTSTGVPAQPDATSSTAGTTNTTPKEDSLAGLDNIEVAEPDADVASPAAVQPPAVAGPNRKERRRQAAADRAASTKGAVTPPSTRKGRRRVRGGGRRREEQVELEENKQPVTYNKLYENWKSFIKG
jgi:hypothetical protein